MVREKRASYKRSSPVREEQLDQGNKRVDGLASFSSKARGTRPRASSSTCHPTTHGSDRSFQKENQGTFEQPLMPSSSEGRLSARPFSTARQRSFLRQDEAEAGTRSRRDRLSWNIRKTLCRKNESERVSSDWAIQDERPTAFPSEEGKRRSLMTTPHSYLYLPRASWTPLNDPHRPLP